MNRYSIASMIKGHRDGTVALLPMIDMSPGLEKAYLKKLRVIEHEMARLIRELVIPAYERKLVVDADESTWDTVRQIINAVAKSTAQQVSQLLELEGKRHTKTWMSKARKAFSINLTSVIADEDLTAYLEQVSIRNASLIRGFSDDLIKNVARQVSDSVISGQSVAKLKEKLKHVLDVSDSRAQLIARDQTSKVNSDLNRIRHQQAGVNRYKWRTSHDERVRPRHRHLDGIEYAYGEPTGAEEGLPPGQPIRCRCIAQGVVEFGVRREQPKVSPPKALRHDDPVAQKWIDSSMNHIPEDTPAHMAISATLPSFLGMVPVDKILTNRAYYHQRRIHMAKEAAQTKRDHEIWRHEYGHHIDMTVVTPLPPSSRALKAMAVEGREAASVPTLRHRRSQRFSEVAALTDRQLVQEFKSYNIDFDMDEWIKSHPTMDQSINMSAHRERANALLMALKVRDPNFLMEAYPDDHVLADFIGAVTNNAKGYGHDKAYYDARKQAGPVEGELGLGHSMEAFANYFAISTATDRTRIQALRTIFPDTVKHFDEIVDEAAKWTP